VSFTSTDLVYHFAPLTPANTPQATPLVQSLVFPPYQVISIDWQVPPGPLGNVGFQLGDSSGDVIVPTNGGWIITNDRVEDWGLWDAVETGSWTFTAYNTGAFDHTVYLDFLCQPWPSQLASTPELTVVPNWPYLAAG
jgi:hypothetical protein